jgi:hypothetical protein
VCVAWDGEGMCPDEGVGPPGWIALALFTPDHLPLKNYVFNGHAIRTLYVERFIVLTIAA